MLLEWLSKKESGRPVMAAKEYDVNISLWADDFIAVVTKMIEFQQAALTTENFYFDKSVWLHGFNTTVNPIAPIEPTNMMSMAFYALEYLASQELGDGVRDAKPDDMIVELQNVISLVFDKNADYGNSALQPPILLPWLDVRCGILVRLSDKVLRLRQLFSNDEISKVAESVEDTLRDIVGYLFLLYSVIRTDELRLKEEKADESRAV